MGEKPFHYWAFISYSSGDEALARRLHKRLETYRIPRDLRGRIGRGEEIPAKLFPIFRDRDELPMSADLGGSLENALEKSRYLLVVCSPSSAGSKWVNEEIRYFKSLGREDRILAVMVGGRNEDGTEARSADCFPPALCHKLDAEGRITKERISPIAGDLRKSGDGWKRTFLKCVAGITGLGFDAFVKRERKRTRRRRFAQGAVALLAVAGGLWAWDYNRTKVSYYEEVVERRGVPVGVNRVEREGLAHRERSLKFESSQRKVRRVTEVDSAGNPRTSERFAPLEASWLEVDYREDGRVAAHRLFRIDGLELIRRAYSEDLAVVEFKDPEGHAAQALTGSIGSLTSRGWGRWSLNEEEDTKTEITRWVQRYDKRGFVVERRFQNAWGAPRADMRGVFGLRFERGEDGQVVREWTLGQDGEPAAASGGRILERRQRYDEHGRIAEVSFHDAQGALVRGESGHAVEQTEWDEWGNDKRRVFLGVDRVPVARPSGFSSLEARYDDDGYLTEQLYFGPEGGPAGGSHRAKYGYDAQGNVSVISLWGWDGGAARNEAGIHRIEKTFNERRQEVEVAYYGVQGDQITHGAQGYHRIKMSYDERGHSAGNSLWGVDGEPVTGPDGWHRIERTYSAGGRLRREACFAAEGPTTDSDGVHEVRFNHDERGNPAGQLCFGVRGEAVISSGGYHRYRVGYDTRGSLQEEAYFGIEGTPVAPEGYHGATFTPDRRGNTREIRLWGPAGEPAYNGEGVHRTTFEYDAAGHVTASSLFGPDGPLRGSGSGVHRTTSAYDAGGNLQQEAYWNESGGETLSNDGYHKIIQEFDVNGNEISEAYFGLQGRPALRPDWGAHRIERRFDEAGNLIDESYCGLNGEPVRSKSGYHRALGSRDGRGRETGWRYVDGEGNPALSDSGVHRLEKVLDQWGRLLEERYFGLGGEPVRDTTDGVHDLRRGYDRNGNKIREWFLDEAGRPAVNNLGYHLRKATFDARGRRLSVSYFETNGNPALSVAGGQHRVERRYDDRGNLTSERYFDTKGAATSSDGGLHEVRRTHDQRGVVIVEEFFGPDGSPVVAPEVGFHRKVQVPDAQGRIVELRYYGAAGQPVEEHNGRHMVRKVFGPQGKVDELTYFDASGAAANDRTQGVHRIRSRHDAAGRLIEIRYFGPDGLPIRHAQGFSRAVQRFNERGQLTLVEFFEEAGHPTDVNGEARREAHFDLESGEPIEVRAFNAAGERVR